MVKAINVYRYKSLRKPSKGICRDIRIKLLKSEDKEKILKAAYKNSNALHVGERLT